VKTLKWAVGGGRGWGGQAARTGGKVNIQTEEGSKKNVAFIRIFIRLIHTGTYKEIIILIRQQENFLYINKSKSLNG
jgi:hypothetical protein